MIVRGTTTVIKIEIVSAKKTEIEIEVKIEIEIETEIVVVVANLLDGAVCPSSFVYPQILILVSVVGSDRPHLVDLLPHLLAPTPPMAVVVAMQRTILVIMAATVLEGMQLVGRKSALVARLLLAIPHPVVDRILAIILVRVRVLVPTLIHLFIIYSSFIHSSIHPFIHSFTHF